MYKCFEHSRLKKQHLDTIVGYTHKSRNFHTVILGGDQRVEKALTEAKRSFTTFKLGEEIENPVGFERPWNLMLLDPSPELFSDPRIPEIIERMPERSCVILVARTTTPTTNGVVCIELDRIDDDELDRLGVAYDDERVMRPQHCPYREESLGIQQYIRETLVEVESARLIIRHTRPDTHWPMDYEVFLLEKTTEVFRPEKEVVTMATRSPQGGSDGFYSLYVENTDGFVPTGCIVAVDPLTKREEKMSYNGIDGSAGEFQSVQRLQANQSVLVNKGTIIKSYVPPLAPKRMPFLSCVHIGELAKRAAKK